MFYFKKDDCEYSLQVVVIPTIHMHICGMAY